MCPSGSVYSAQCGEKYMSGAVSEKIYEVLQSEQIITEKHLNVPVVSLAA